MLLQTNHQVICDFLPKESFIKIKDYMESMYMSWYFKPGVASYDDTSDSYFTHCFYEDYTVNSDMFPMISPILEKLNGRELIRARANLYTRNKELIEHAKHVDFSYEHKAFILYINTNDGFTRLEDGTKVESIANSALFFDGSTLHNSTNCTNNPCRITLSINYF